MVVIKKTDLFEAFLLAAAGMVFKWNTNFFIWCLRRPSLINGGNGSRECAKNWYR